RCLDHGRQPVRDRRPGRADEGDRPVGGAGHPEGEEGTGALVEVDVHPDATVPGEGEGDRGGARPGGDAGVPEAEAVELAAQLSHAGESDVAVRRRGGGGHDEEASRRSGATRRGTSLPWTGSRGRAVTSSASREAVPMP